MWAFKILQMTHTFWYKHDTPEDSNNSNYVTFKQRLEVIYRIIFADHFLNLGHTAK